MNFRNIIRYTSGAVFLISALLKLVDYNSTAELFTSILGFEIMLAKIFLGVLILLELIIAYLLIADYIKNKFIFLSIAGMITTFIIINLFFLLKGYSNCGCFGKSISSTPVSSIIKNIILLFGLYYLKKAKLTNDKIDTLKGFE